MHANAWPLIEKYLKLRQKRQRDLAELLSVTPAAVSQIKSERILLNPLQIEKIIHYLQLSPADCEKLYMSLFSARVLPSEKSTPATVFSTGWQERELPVGELELLCNYEPELEPMDQYFARNTKKRFRILCARPGLSIVTLNSQKNEPGTPGFSALLLDMLAQPSPEYPHLVLTEDRQFCIFRPAQYGDGICFNFDFRTVSRLNQKFRWQRSIIALDIPLELS